MSEAGLYVYLYVMEETEQKKRNRIFPTTHRSRREETTSPITQFHLILRGLLPVSGAAASGTWICWTMFRSCTRNSLASLARSDSPFSAWDSWLCKTKKEDMELKSHEVTTRANRAVLTRDPRVLGPLRSLLSESGHLAHSGPCGF